MKNSNRKEDLLRILGVFGILMLLGFLLAAIWGVMVLEFVVEDDSNQEDMSQIESAQ